MFFPHQILHKVYVVTIPHSAKYSCPTLAAAGMCYICWDHSASVAPGHESLTLTLKPGPNPSLTLTLTIPCWIQAGIMNSYCDDYVAIGCMTAEWVIALLQLLTLCKWTI